MRLREGIQLQRIGQKDPLVEYKNEAYSMFVELMTNIKFEVLHNLFRSTSNLQAFEKFLASLPQNLLARHAHEPTVPRHPLPRRIRHRQNHDRNASGGLLSKRLEDHANVEMPSLEIPARRELPKVGRNEACPCGSGRKFKNCCGKLVV